MKKALVFCLIIMLLFSTSAQAEYEQYQLTEGNTLESLQMWEVFPLDQHNVIVRAQTPQPWNVTWYRDGQVYRTLGAEGEWDSVTSAEPVFENGTTFYMLCRVPAAVEEETAYPPPNATAQWTDSGLVNKAPLAECVKATRWGNRILILETDQYQRIRYNGKETVIPRKLADYLRSSDCIALADEVFLMTYRDPDAGESKLLCLDHGNVRYKIDDSLRGWEMFPDGKQGFLSVDWDYIEWSDERDFSPVRLHHVDGNGQLIQTYRLSGDQVIITPTGSFFNPNDETITIYGSAENQVSKIFVVFAMTLDENMNVTGLDVRNIDPDYLGCEAVFSLTAAGFPYVYLYNRWHPDAVRPVVIPFSLLEPAEENYGLALK